jgi:hypothetical protein
VAVAEVPEILAVVVKVPLGAGEDAAGGKFEQDSVGVVVLVVGRVVGDAVDEATVGEGDEEMGVVDVMQGEHGAAREQIARVDGLEAQGFEQDTLDRWGSAGNQGRGKQDREQGEERRKQAPAKNAFGRCDSWGWNRHSLGCVLLSHCVRSLNVSQTEEGRQWMQRGRGTDVALDEAPPATSPVQASSIRC